MTWDMGFDQLGYDPGYDPLLSEVRHWLTENAPRGVDCPACSQFCKIYLRQMTAVPALGVMLLSRPRLNVWIHLTEAFTEAYPRLAGQGGYRNLGVHWKLIEERRVLREDGGRAGYWRSNAAGRAYVYEELKIPKYAVIYNGQCLGYVGPLVTIHDALGTKFNLNDLLRGE